jgi:uncharacterized protein (DUF1778 family)
MGVFMDVPMMLTVPLPGGNSGRNHGVKSLRYSTADRVIFRIRHSDRETIKRAAELLNMSEAQFVRETAVNMSKTILKHAEEHNAHASDRSG